MRVKLQRNLLHAVMAYDEQRTQSWPQDPPILVVLDLNEQIEHPLRSAIKLALAFAHFQKLARERLNPVPYCMAQEYRDCRLSFRLHIYKQR